MHQERTWQKCNTVLCKYKLMNMMVKSTLSAARYVRLFIFTCTNTFIIVYMRMNTEIFNASTVLRYILCSCSYLCFFFFWSVFYLFFMHMVSHWRSPREIHFCGLRIFFNFSSTGDRILCRLFFFITAAIL